MIRVFVADDHPIVRRGIVDLLETEPGIEVVGQAENGQEAVLRIEGLDPDVVLMDLVMPVMDGIEAIRRIRKMNDEIRILVLTSFATDDKVFPAIKAGAIGYLMKDSSPGDLLDAIRKVARNEPSLDPGIAQKLLGEITGQQARPPASDPLTDREVDVLRLIARGLSNQEIAGVLVVSPATVYTHVSSILSKLHLASRTQAAIYALREGFASLYDPEEGKS